MNLICEACGAKLPEELIKNLRNGKKIVCEICGATISPDFLSEQEEDQTQPSQSQNPRSPINFDQEFQMQLNKVPDQSKKHIIGHDLFFNSFRYSRPSLLSRIKAFLIRLKWKMDGIFHRKHWKSKPIKRRRGHGSGHRRHGR